jgi:hypothetical protein
MVYHGNIFFYLKALTYYLKALTYYLKALTYENEFLCVHVFLDKSTGAYGLKVNIF